jgi:hypothetical protein
MKNINETTVIMARIAELLRGADEHAWVYDDCKDARST